MLGKVTGSPSRNLVKLSMKNALKNGLPESPVRSLISEISAIPMVTIIKVVAVFDIHMDSSALAAIKPAMRPAGWSPDFDRIKSAMPTILKYSTERAIPK